jgi:hypothetical protein
MLALGLALAAVSPNCSDAFPQYFTCGNEKCAIGANVTAQCRVSDRINCSIDRAVDRVVPCVYCWQLPESALRCFLHGSQCRVSPRPQTGTCSVNPGALCLGPRTFSRRMYCGASSGYSFTTALLLSLCFGGFGADRFYLGHVATGFVKLLTFGGGGLWSLVDVVLLCCGALTPQDGTLFVERAGDYIR